MGYRGYERDIPDPNWAPTPSNAPHHGCMPPPPSRGSTELDSTCCCWVLIGLVLFTKACILCEERRRKPGQTLMHV